jgi:hypothetical protein
VVGPEFDTSNASGLLEIPLPSTIAAAIVFDGGMTERALI